MDLQLKYIPWYEWYYSATKSWEIYSHRSKRFLYQGNNHWYLQVILSLRWNTITHKVHRLILLTYIWESNLDVNHKDWNKSNNHISNLEYCTRSENSLHSYYILWNKKTDTQKKVSGESCRRRFSKRVWQFNLDWTLVQIWFNARDCIKYNFNCSHIRSCCRWERRTHQNFIWKYI